MATLMVTRTTRTSQVKTRNVMTSAATRIMRSMRSVQPTTALLSVVHSSLMKTKARYFSGTLVLIGQI